MYFAVITTLLSLLFISVNTSTEKLNVLLILVDDLRPNIGAYGVQNVHTPNIDKLANRSIIFRNAYAQQALCAPSRNSFLTSRRPDSLRLYDFNSYWRTTVGNFTTLPQLFKENGYHAHSIGKVFHPGVSSNWTDDGKYSWSQTPYHPSTEKYKEAKVCLASNGKLARNVVCPVLVEMQPEGTLPDLQILEAALEFLKYRENEVDQKPYFLAVGFHKPHIPLKFPSEYLAYHPLENIKLPPNHQRPSSLPTVAWNPWNDVRRRDNIAKLNLSFPFGLVPDKTLKLITQSYNAATTYIDDLIGQLLEKVDSQTVVVLLGDHGWSLGEHGELAKYSNFDVATRVPFVIHIPNLTENGFSTDSLVELVDLFPTLVDIANVSDSVPLCNQDNTNSKLCTEGKSLLPLITATVKNKNYSGKSAIFNQYPRPRLYPTQHPNSDEPKLKEIKIMGYSIRTAQYRYTEWVEFNNNDCKPNWNNVFSRELYDHWLDVDENLNLASKPELQNIQQILSQKLRRGWRYI